MARYPFVIRPCYYNKFCPQFSDAVTGLGSVLKAKTHFKNWVVSIRNLFRNGETYVGLPSFEQIALPGSRYKVSDIGEWIVSARYYACAFEVKDIIDNVSWLFVFKAPDLFNDTTSSGTPIYQIFGGSSSESVWYKYFQRATSSTTGAYTGTLSTTTSFGTNGRDMLIFYNPQADSQANDFKMNFSSWANLTYGADFTTVTAPPINDGAATTFMPDHNKWPRGIYYDSSWWTYPSDYTQLDRSKEVFVFDTVNPVLNYTIQIRGAYTLASILGDIYTPRDGGDLYEQGTHWWVFHNGDNNASYTLQLPFPSTVGAGSSGHGETLKADGTRVHVYDYPLYDLNIKTMKDLSGDYIWKEVAVKNITTPLPTYDKGWFKGTVAMECFPVNDIKYMFRVVDRPDSSNPMMKVGASICVVWAPNFLAPPFVWPYEAISLDTV